MFLFFNRIKKINQKTKKKKKNPDLNDFCCYIPLTRALTEALGVGVPNVSVSHIVYLKKKERKRRDGRGKAPLYNNNHRTEKFFTVVTLIKIVYVAKPRCFFRITTQKECGEI
jgi:hypothetical protein